MFDVLGNGLGDLREFFFGGLLVGCSNSDLRFYFLGLVVLQGCVYFWDQIRDSRSMRVFLGPSIWCSKPEAIYRPEYRSVTRSYLEYGGVCDGYHQ